MDTHPGISARALALVTVLTTLAGPASCGARELFVDSAANQPGPGSKVHPFKTIQAAADTARRGDVVTVRPGTYRESVTLTRSGSRGRPIRFRARGRAVLNGSGELESGFKTAYGRSARGPSYIKISGFEIKGYASFGLVAWSSNNSITLSKLSIHGNGGTGIRFSNSRGSSLSNIDLSGNRTGGFDCTPILPGKASDPGCVGLKIDNVRATSNGNGNDTAVDAFAVERGSRVTLKKVAAENGPGDCIDLKSDRSSVINSSANGCARNGIKLWGKRSRVTGSSSRRHGLEALVLAAGGSYNVEKSTFADPLGYGYTAYVGDGPKHTVAELKGNTFSNAISENGGTLLYISPSTRLTATGNRFFDPYREDCVADITAETTCLAADRIEQRISSASTQWNTNSYQGPG